MLKSKFSLPLILIIALLSSGLSNAAVLLEWKAPTVRAGEGAPPFTASSADTYTLYRDGVQIKTLPGNVLTYTDPIPLDCVGHAYEITITEKSSGLTSEKGIGLAGVDGVKCRPLAPTLVTVKPQ